MKTENSVLLVALVPLECLVLFSDLFSCKTFGDLEPYRASAVFG